LITLAKYTTKLVIWPLLFLTEQVYESYTIDQSSNTNLENYTTMLSPCIYDAGLLHSSQWPKTILTGGRAEHRVLPPTRVLLSLVSSLDFGINSNSPLPPVIIHGHSPLEQRGYFILL